MYISSGQSIMNFRCCPQSCQSSIGSIKQRVFRCIITRLNPLALEHSPNCFGNIEMRGIRGQEKEKQTSIFPNRPHFHHQLTPVNLCVVEYKKCIFLYAVGKSVKVICYCLGCHGICRGKAIVITFIIDHPEYVETTAFLRWDKHIFPWKLPSIRHVATGANMGFVPKIKINHAILVLSYKILQFFALILINLRRRFPFWTFSYTPKSCAKADKKLLNVLRQAFLPVAFCHLSFAFITLRRSFSMASFTIFSSEASIIGLRPWPALFSNPSKPLERYLFTHRFTVGSETESSCAISRDDLPSDFIKTIWQRFCREGFVPKYT